MKGTTSLLDSDVGYSSMFVRSSNSELISREHIFLKKVKSIITDNLNHRGISAIELADQMHLSVSQLNRKLKFLVGRPAGRLILEIRLRHAAKLLDHNTGTIGEIAHQTGFSDQAHFSRSFKKLFGCTPSAYRTNQIRLNVQLIFQ